MKTVSFPGVGPVAGLSRGVLKGAVTTAILAMTVGNLLAMPTVTWISGGPNAGYVNGYINDNVSYNTPSGLAVDESGEYLLVADRNNNTVRLLDFNINATSTLLTYTNYVITTNIFSQPISVAIDDNYNIFVLNRAQGNNGTILEFDDTSELIATNLAHITNAGGMCIDPDDDIFVTASNSVIEVTAEGAVSTIATITASNANLQGIVYKHNGLLAVCDYGRDGILLINPADNNVTTNAGFHGQGDFVTTTDTSISNTATFFHPLGIAESGDGTLIVCDNGNSRVKAVLANGSVTNVYGIQSNYWAGEEYPGFQDGTVALPDGFSGVAARLPNGVVVAPDGSLYVSEDYYHILRHITGAGFITQPPPLPAPPTILTATVVTNAGAVAVKLVWNTSITSDVTNYIVGKATSTNGPFNDIIDQTPGTSFVDTNVVAGQTYYYAVQAENAAGESGYSPQAFVNIPVQPPVAPTIGWYQYSGNVQDGFTTVLIPFAPGANNVFNNLISMAILPNASGVQTYYISGPTPLSGNPINGANAPFFENFMLSPPQPLPVTIVPNLTIEAANVNAEGQESQVTSDQVVFQCANPVINGTNAAQFTLYDLTTNASLYFTTDGSNPLTNTQAQVVISTNGRPVTVSLNISSTFTLSVVAEYAGFAPSAVVTNLFLAQNFQGNELTWGFQSGYCSSEFIASPGEIFYAPVTLTTLPGAAMYGLEFDMVVTNLGPDPVPSGDFSFQSMLQYQGTASNTVGVVYYPIPPYMFIGDASSPPPPNQIVSYNGTNFVDLEVANTNLNELAVGWFEVLGHTNLFNTLSQNLLSYSLAFIQLIPGGSFQNDVIVGGYAFQVPTNAVPGEQYEIQLNRASANGDGLGGPDSAVVVTLPENGSLSNGTINATKIVTIGQPSYMAGDVYPFHWFNAGDFGNGDLTNYAANDVEAIFNAAIYDINDPSANEPGSDFADAMDAAGGIGTYDAAAGYWVKTGTANTAEYNALFNANDSTTINEMAFGDGKLDICDVYVTFIRSQFPNVNWFERFYTNDPVHGVFGRVAQAIYPQTNIDNNAAVMSPAVQSAQVSSPVSITNTPVVNFTAGDYQASAGQTVSIPITATVFGQNPMRTLMFNAGVVPLDGSPAVTSAINFSLASPFNNSSIFNQPNPLNGTESYSTTNFAAAIIPTTFPIAANAAVAGSTIIGYLSFTVPANATSQSSYAIYFDHASASPNGLISFPRTTFTGLVTLSSRTNSYYGDGIPDSWRLRYFGTIYNELSVSNANADGTTMNNWQKYQAGLNPVDATSVLNEGFDQTMAQSSQDHVVYWPSVSGQTYIIERSATLFPPQWTAISTNIGSGSYMEIHDSAGGGKGYYEVTTP